MGSSYGTTPNSHVSHEFGTISPLVHPSIHPDSSTIHYPESQNTTLGLQEARRQIKQEAALLTFLSTSAPDLLAPRVLAYDPDPHNPIQAPFIIETRLEGQSLLQSSCTEIFAEFDWVSSLNCVCLLVALISMTGVLKKR